MVWKNHLCVPRVHNVIFCSNVERTLSRENCRIKQAVTRDWALENLVVNLEILPVFNFAFVSIHWLNVIVISHCIDVHSVSVRHGTCILPTIVHQGGPLYFLSKVRISSLYFDLVSSALSITFHLLKSVFNVHTQSGISIKFYSVSSNVSFIFYFFVAFACFYFRFSFLLLMY